MFSIFKKKVVVVSDDYIRCRSGGEIVSKYSNEIKLIYETLAMPEEHFKELYIKFIEEVAYFIQALPATEKKNYNNFEGLLAVCLEGGTNALKKRRGFMLPPGSRTDLIDEQRSIWSYAVFTSSVIIIIQNALVHCEIETSEDGKNFNIWNFNSNAIGDSKYFRVRRKENKNITLPSIYGTFIFKKLITTEGLIWLSSDEYVFKEWIGCVTKNKNLIDWLSAFSHESFLFPTVGNENKDEVESNDNINQDKDKEEIHKNSKKADADQYDLNLDPSDKNNSENENYSLSEEENALVTDFFDWAKKMIDDGDLTMNNNSGLVHSIDKGIFLVLPAVFNRYKDSKKLSKDLPKKLESLIMFKDDGIVKSDKGTNIHLFKVYKKDLKGFIVLPEVLGMATKPPLNKAFNVCKNVEKDIDISF